MCCFKEINCKYFAFVPVHETHTSMSYSGFAAINLEWYRSASMRNWFYFFFVSFEIERCELFKIESKHAYSLKVFNLWLISIVQECLLSKLAHFFKSLSLYLSVSCWIFFMRLILNAVSLLKMQVKNEHLSTSLPERVAHEHNYNFRYKRFGLICIFSILNDVNEILISTK